MTLSDVTTPDTAPAPLPDVLNLKKVRLDAAVQTAQSAEATVAPSGNPASAVSSVLAGAWISHPTADDFITDLDGVGTSLRNAFQDAVTHLQSLANAQPTMVPHDDPRGQSGYGGPGRRAE